MQFEPEIDNIIKEPENPIDEEKIEEPEQPEKTGEPGQPQEPDAGRKKRLYILLAILIVVSIVAAGLAIRGIYKSRDAKNSAQPLASEENNEELDQAAGYLSSNQNAASFHKNDNVNSAEEEEEDKDGNENSADEVKTEEQAAGQENQGETPTSQEALEPNLTFAILGDTQGYQSGNPQGGYQKAVKLIQNFNPDLVISTGDLVPSCSKNCEEKLADWKKELGPLAGKIYPAVGNHDRTGGDKSDKAWQKVFVLPTNGPKGYSELTYSFDFDNSHFVILDSAKPEEHSIDSDQRDWLSNDLAHNTKENTFVFFHEPAFPVSSKRGESLDAEKKTRDKLWSILDNYNVTAVFSGHEHLHSRRKINSSLFPGAKNEIYQFIVGNTDTYSHDVPQSGVVEYFYQERDFLLVSVAGKEITVKVYSVDGKEVNSFSFSKTPS